MMNGAPANRPASWKWLVCGLLLCASMLLYMDRQTLPNVATRITKEFALSQQEYGDIEAQFGYAFAAGALLWGLLIDRFTVRWLYPALLLAWSVMGFLTGLVEDYAGLLLCRTLLGFFESGHWPCALKTTQRLLSSGQRTLGNSVLQSGASFGAILTPLVMQWMLAGRMEAGVWRKPFLVIGCFGVVWIAAWFVLLKRNDFGGRNEHSAPGESAPAGAGEKFWHVLLTRRFAALVVVVVCINICWQLMRAWLPKFLQEGRGYTEAQALYFNSVFYAATDVGCLVAGAASLWLVRRGVSIHGSRARVYGVCAVLTSLTVGVAMLPRGGWLLGLLLVIGAGALGLFPCYYSFSQELSPRHQGKVTGVLSTVAWMTSSPLQSFFGWLVDTTKSFNTGIAVIGVMPLVGFLALRLLWDKGGPAAPAERKVDG